jgi:ubiquinone/menaquinone biosynthesis C-methylase UbiE
MRDLFEVERFTLANQAIVVWPGERPLLERAAGSRLRGRVLDLCCGTGQILRRLRATYAPRLAVGVDLYRGHLRHAEPPVVHADAYVTPFADATFDLVVVRHILQALPDPVGLLREARRVLRPDGVLHVVAEDYAALFFDADPGTEWHFAEVTPRFAGEGTDLAEGRRAYRHLREAGFRDVAIAPLLVDNLTVDRDALAEVFRFWRDGYAAKLAAVLDVDEPEVRRRFDAMSACARDPDRYTAWLLFVLSAKP